MKTDNNPKPKLEKKPEEKTRVHLGDGAPIWPPNGSLDIDLQKDYHRPRASS